VLYISHFCSPFVSPKIDVAFKITIGSKFNSDLS
jgi:hypothetical protein